MSEEMNLYKRCKNIFKAHGVDMGGGGSGGFEYDLIIKLVGETATLVKGDYNALVAKMRAFEPVISVVWLDQSADGMIMQYQVLGLVDENVGSAGAYLSMMVPNPDGGTFPVILMSDNTVIVP